MSRPDSVDRHLGPAATEREIVAAAPPLPTITERELTTYVRDLAKLYRWKRYHTWISKHSAKGFPDEVLVRGERLIFAELKSEKGKVSGAQQEWLDDLLFFSGKVHIADRGIGTASVEIYVWRPSDMERIAEILR